MQLERLEKRLQNKHRLHKRQRQSNLRKKTIGQNYSETKGTANSKFATETQSHREQRCRSSSVALCSLWQICSADIFP